MKNGRFRIPDDLSILSDEEVSSIHEEIGIELAKIKSQIDQAIAYQLETGEYADPIWFAKANSARRYMGHQHQLLQKENSRRNKLKKLHDKEKLDSIFVKVAKNYLNEKDFQAILEQAIFQKDL